MIGGGKPVPSGAPGKVQTPQPEPAGRNVTVPPGDPIEHPPHPVLCKVAEGAKLCALSREARECALSDNSILLQGADGCFAHLDYDSVTGGILCAFTAGKHWRYLEEAQEKQKLKWVTPSWALSEKVKVHAKLNEMLNSFINPEGDQVSLMAAGVHLSEVRAVS